MSYTLFAFCRLMFSMCLLFLFPDFVIVSPKYMLNPPGLSGEPFYRIHGKSRENLE